MRRHQQLSSIVFLLAIALAGLAFASTVIARSDKEDGCTQADAFCYMPQLTRQFESLESVHIPKIATPAWLSAPAAPATVPSARQVSYTVASRGSVKADINEFAAQVNETLNAPTGWSRLGIRFVRVESGGSFTVWLSEASQVPGFSQSGCDAIVSCTVGNNVIINETRWLNGSDAWNGAGGALRDYRHMVVNHETGHWLGHGHQQCAGAGQLAAVMQQQTINMQSCKPNPWPLSGELYAPKLGIRS